MHGAYPGNIGWGVAKLPNVVGLKDAEGVDIAPGVEADEVGDESLGPGLEATIWRGSWSVF